METEAPELSTVVEETSQAVDTPVAPDATAAPSPAGEEPAPDSQGTTASARPRDEHGRFTKQELAKQASDAANAVVPAVADAPTPPAPPPPKGDPFVFRADGQKIPVPGATLTADGALTIPPDQVPGIRQLLAEGVTYRGSWRQKEQDFQRQIQEATSVEKARAEKYNNAAVILWNRVEQLLADSPQELALFRREMDLELRSADLKIPKVAEPPKPITDDPVQLEKAARAGLDEYIEELLELPEAKAAGFTAEERQALKARFQRRLQAYYVEHPEKAGEIVLDTELPLEDFRDELKTRAFYAKQAEEKAKATQFNAARATPVVQAPPVVSTRGAGGSTAAPTQYSDREAWRKAMGIN